MLIDFRVSNFRSIGEEQILSLIPATDQEEYQENIFREGKIEALNVIAIYGANASGKSNLLRALKVFRSIIQGSIKHPPTELLEYDPFFLRDGWEQKPTTFEITVTIEKIRYRYGFSYDRSEIAMEWLFRKTTGREVTIFKRQGEIIDPTSSLKGNAKIIDGAIEATRENSLFLSALDLFNIPEADTILKSLSALLVVDGSMSRNDPERGSGGSMKVPELSDPVTLSLEAGGILIVDDIGAGMHPLLRLATINLFLNKETNPRNAQLIFSTHDTTLLSYARLRRDQIYFAEKNSWQSTDIYSLSDFIYVDETSGSETKERPDTDKEKRYLEGRYGAVPRFFVNKMPSGPNRKIRGLRRGII